METGLVNDNSRATHTHAGNAGHGSSQAALPGSERLSLSTDRGPEEQNGGRRRRQGLKRGPSLFPGGSHLAGGDGARTAGTGTNREHRPTASTATLAAPRGRDVPRHSRCAAPGWEAGCRRAEGTARTSPAPRPCPPAGRQNGAAGPAAARSSRRSSSCFQTSHVSSSPPGLGQREGPRPRALPSEGPWAHPWMALGTR